MTLERVLERVEEWASMQSFEKSHNKYAIEANRVKHANMANMQADSGSTSLATLLGKSATTSCT